MTSARFLELSANPPRSSAVRQTTVVTPVQLIKKPSRLGSYGSDYAISVCGVEVGIDRDEYLTILAGQLPDAELVWSINERQGDTFFRDGFPEWSVVPSPRSEVGGNIYFGTREQATRALTALLEKKIDAAAKRIEAETADLRLKLASLTNPTPKE